MNPGASADIVQLLVLAFFGVFSIGYSTLLVLAARNALHELSVARRRTFTHEDLAASPSQPVVTVIVPAHEEAESILPTVRSLLAQRWHQLEVIVVPNGCTDATLDVLRDAFDLRPTSELLTRPPGSRGRIQSIWSSASDPRLRVIETSGGGKADATNCALERASGEFCLLVDADSLLAPHAIARTMIPFIERGEAVIAVSAGIRVLNGSRVREDGTVESGIPTSALARMQTVEYARAFHIGRAGWASLDALPVVSGAFGMFRTSILRAVGGLDPDTVGEDLEIILRLHSSVRRRGRRAEICFIPEPLCWTEVPEDVASLRAQRIRWHRGLVEGVQRHGGMLLNSRHGAVGLLSFPFLGLFELLAPLIELLGLAALVLAAVTGAISWLAVVALIAFAVAFGMALSMAAVLLEQLLGPGFVSRPRDVFALLRAALREQFGHRQRTAAWRLQGLVAGVRGGRASWGEMHHRGAREVAR
ncbi:MAG: glycosyltransferase [Thermoleophilia bacterium]|nr:glycosyltransferase [Thermoleophilia bacterium]